jgi:cell division protein FtsA
MSDSAPAQSPHPIVSRPLVNRPELASSPRRHGRDGPVGTVGVLDLGTSKIACIIAQTEPNPRLLGLGHHRARGIKAGMIVDMDEAEQAVRAAVSQAERQAGVTLQQITISIGGGSLGSLHFSASAPVPTGVVGNNDMARLIDGARHYVERDGRRLIHLNAIAYHIDGSPGLRDARGMAGRTVSGDMHAVSTDASQLSNLHLLLERCFLTVDRFIPAGIASARATATSDELRAGITVIDIGAGTTSIAVIADGHDLFVDEIPMGGDHVTFDIVRALGTPVVEAERIKILYGTMVGASSDERDCVSYPRLVHSDYEVYQTTRAELHRLIKPRIESLLTQAMGRLAERGLQAYGGNQIVLTGGSAQLTGLAIFAGRHLGRSVRVAHPVPLFGMGLSSCSPAFATVIGLVAAGAHAATLPVGKSGRMAADTGYLERMSQWLRDSF